MGSANNDSFETKPKKGTSYLRKQKEQEKLSKDKKRSKRLSAYRDNERAKSNEYIHNYLSGNYDEDDYYDF